MVIALLLGLACAGTAVLLSLGVVADARARRDGVHAPPTRLRTAALCLGLAAVGLLLPVLVVSG